MMHFGDSRPRRFFQSSDPGVSLPRGVFVSASGAWGPESPLPNGRRMAPASDCWRRRPNQFEQSDQVAGNEGEQCLTTTLLQTRVSNLAQTPKDPHPAQSLFDRLAPPQGKGFAEPREARPSTALPLALRATCCLTLRRRKYEVGGPVTLVGSEGRPWSGGATEHSLCRFPLSPTNGLSGPATLFAQR